MRIVLITPHYPPLNSSTAVQMRDLAREFVAHGHETTVLTPDPRSNSPWALTTENGVQVLRLRAQHGRDVGYVRRTLAEAALPWAMLRGLDRSPLASTGWDGVVWWAPSIFLGPLVRALKRRSHCSSYLILRDLFPDWAVDLGLMRKGLAYRFFKIIERQQYAAADVVGVQSPSTVACLPQLQGRPSPRVEVLWNWLSPAPLVTCSIDVGATAIAGRVIIAYIGNIGVAQNLGILLDVAKRLAERDDIGFLFVGRGSELPRLRAQAVAMGLRNAIFYDEIDADEVPALLAQCHVGFVALDPRHTTHNIPGKFLSYLRAGLPVLARVNANNDLVSLIEGAGVGRVASDTTAESLLAAVQAMASDPEGRALMAARGRELARDLFSTATAVRQITSALEPIRGAGFMFASTESKQS